MTQHKYISYLRVSTFLKTVEPRLGLSAWDYQSFFATADGAEIIREMVEAVSGKDINNRPLLKAAIKECNEKGYFLIVAKLESVEQGCRGYFQNCKTVKWQAQVL